MSDLAKDNSGGRETEMSDWASFDKIHNIFKMMSAKEYHPIHCRV
jgi:hypothetical protein